MRKSFSHFSDHQGFALPVVFGIVLFLSLLFLALDHLLKISSMRVHAQLTSEIARQNARSALEIAMADLESQVQSCRAVTAMATILGDGVPPQNAHWTGVWKVEKGRPVFSKWLVSGEDSEGRDGAKKAFPEAVQMLMDYGLKDACPAVPIFLHGRVAGHYAYWIGDENLKARVNLPDPSLPRSEIVQQFGGEWLGEMGLPDSQRHRLTAERNFHHLWGLNPDFAAHFHDISLSSAGIFTNPLSGEDLEDISTRLSKNRFRSHDFLFQMDDSFPEPPPTWGQLASYFATIGSRIQNQTISPQVVDSPYLFRFSSHPNILITLSDLPQCDANPLVPMQLGIPQQHGIGPLILEFSLTAGVRVAEGQLAVSLQPRVVLWNPYEVRLGPADYQFRWNLADSALPGRPGFIYAGKPIKLGADFSDRLWLGKFRASFDPGEIKIVGLAQDMAADATQPGVLSENGIFGAIRMPVPLDPQAPLRLSRRASLFSNLSWGNFSLRLEDSRGHLFQEIHDVVDSEPPDRDYPISSDGKTSYLFSWIARARTDSHIRWLANYNPRATQIRRGAFEDRTISLLPGSSLRRHLPTWDSTFSEINSPNAPIFDLPCVLGSYSPILFAVPQQLWSLGWLQHLNLAPFSYLCGSAIGNSWGNPRVPRNALRAPEIFENPHHFLRTEMAWDYCSLLNAALYDHYFVSGFGNLEDGGKTFTLCYFPDGDGSQSRGESTAMASVVLNAGAFNVNSTSPLAWELLFRGAMDRDLPGHYSFPRHGNQERQGDVFLCRRCLSLGEVRRLAESMVEQICRRGPFCSLSQFINRQLIVEEEDKFELGCGGALQQAIAHSGINGDLSHRDHEVFEGRSQPWFDEALASGFANDNAPGYLTSADLLQYLGNSFTTHSDTFLIRGYGDYCRGETVVSRACCEMLVQRLPDHSWQRVYFRWID